MKRAQIQMFESTMVLLFFFVFVGIGLVFYFNASKQSLNRDIEKFQTLDAIKVALLASSAPEFVYTSGDWKDTTSFDKQKLEAFKSLGLMANDYLYDYYFQLFGYSTLYVDQIYPTEGFPFHVVLYNRTKPHWKTRQTFKMPVGLRDVVKDRIDLGVLTVQVWQ